MLELRADLEQFVVASVTMVGSFARSLEGGEVVDGLMVPDVTADTLAKRGFNTTSLSEYLSSGISAQGTAFGSMYTVTHFSTSAMQSADVGGQLLTPAKGPEPLHSASDTALPSGRTALAAWLKRRRQPFSPGTGCSPASPESAD